MKKLLLLSIVLLLTSCGTEVEKICYNDVCNNSMEYGIEGDISVSSIDKGTVNFQSSVIDDMRLLKNIKLSVYTIGGEFVWNAFDDYANVFMYQESSKGFNIHFLDPSTEYYALVTGILIVEGENVLVQIAFTEFTTLEFTKTEITGRIDNVRVGDTFAICDIELLSSDYYLVVYHVILYKGEDIVGDYFLNWGSRNQAVFEQYDIVFNNLTADTTYKIVLEALYQEEIHNQSSVPNLLEVVFTTK